MTNQSCTLYTQPQITRKNWADWIRALGMLFIIYGHCFPIHFTPFVYSFNVGLFFFMSGYLTKRASKNDHFWKKLLISLIIPYLILTTIKAFPHFFTAHGGTTALAILTGFHSIDGIAGCSNLWFVHTLILLKIVMRLFGRSGWSRIILLFLSIIGSVVYNMLGMDIAWSVTDMFLAVPFFILGNTCRENNAFSRISELVVKANSIKICVAALLLLAITFGVSHYNGAAWLYRAHYGSNLLLFFISAVAGILFLLVVSLRLDKVKSKAVTLIANGNIVILTFHMEVNRALLKFVRNQDWGSIVTDIATFVVSILTLLAFVPIIMVLKKYCPVVIGMRRAN